MHTFDSSRFVFPRVLYLFIYFWFYAEYPVSISPIKSSSKDIENIYDFMFFFPSEFSYFSPKFLLSFLFSLFVFASDIQGFSQTSGNFGLFSLV